jgi:pimeloyl-ACP methyl ester carboxylesterase
MVSVCRPAHAAGMCHVQVRGHLPAKARLHGGVVVVQGAGWRWRGVNIHVQGFLGGIFRAMRSSHCGQTRSVGSQAAAAQTGMSLVGLMQSPILLTLQPMHDTQQTTTPPEEPAHAVPAYAPRRTARSTTLALRTLPYHVLQWGTPQPGVPPLVMVHGWMDVGASYQFVVDALTTDRWVVAPDWRGFGLTPSGGADSFWFPDYLADLDALLDLLSPDAPVDLVGHSMGGNVAMMYAGIRPERIRTLVNLEGFGLPAAKPAQAPSRYALWMDELKALRQGDKDLKTYPSQQAVAQRLQKTNPRLTADKALWLAGQWAAPDAQGQWRILGEAGHKLVNPQLYRVEEVLAIYLRIAAPTLAVEASHNQMAKWWQNRYTLDEYHERLKSVPNVRVEVINDAGHMLHHDQPEAVARLIEAHLPGN